MPTTRSPSSAAPSAASSRDAIKLLTDDHKAVKALFKKYDSLAGAGAEAEERQALAEQICDMLTVHATVEEEIFYPAAREVLGDDEDLVDEADIEHACAKELIAQIQAAKADSSHYDAMVKVLGEYIAHHVLEEEGEMFPKAKKSGLDSKTLGAAIHRRKEQLTVELAGATEAS
jgi:hemerythrin superfamily protein